MVTKEEKHCEGKKVYKEEKEVRIQVLALFSDRKVKEKFDNS